MTSEEKELRKRCRRAFRMPSVQSMKARKTSITNAFVSTIVPVIKPTDDEIIQSLTILGMTPETVQCIYCGDKCSAWDHLRPIVDGRKPTGYISEIVNLVPSCQPCNSSKGNSNWKQWMLGNAAQSPKTRQVRDLMDRVSRLEDYEQWRAPTFVDFRAILGSRTYDEYWAELERIIVEMSKSQQLADSLREKIQDASPDWHPRSVRSTPSEEGSNKKSL